MIALDTSVLARFLLADDAAQFAAAKALLATPQQFTVPVTVLLELVWVLEVNDVKPRDIAHGLQQLLRLPNLTAEPIKAVQQALTHCEQGMDFADALHLAMSTQTIGLASFDKRFVKLAAKLDTTPVVTLVKVA